MQNLSSQLKGLELKKLRTKNYRRDNQNVSTNETKFIKAVILVLICQTPR
jgi:hypothetical protein